MNLYYVDLNDSTKIFDFKMGSIPRIGDIYLAGNTKADLTKSLYKEEYYVLLDTDAENGFHVAPYKTFSNEFNKDVKDDLYVKLLLHVCKYENQEVFWHYINRDNSKFYEKCTVSRPFGTMVRWVEKNQYSKDVDFVKRDYLTESQYKARGEIK